MNRNEGGHRMEPNWNVGWWRIWFWFHSNQVDLLDSEPKLNQICESKYCTWCSILQRSCSIFSLITIVFHQINVTFPIFAHYCHETAYTLFAVSRFGFAWSRALTTETWFFSTAQYSAVFLSCKIRHWSQFSISSELMGDKNWPCQSYLHRRTSSARPQ